MCGCLCSIVHIMRSEGWGQSFPCTVWVPKVPGLETGTFTHWPSHQPQVNVHMWHEVGALCRPHITCCRPCFSSLSCLKVLSGNHPAGRVRLRDFSVVSWSFCLLRSSELVEAKVTSLSLLSLPLCVSVHVDRCVLVCRDQRSVEYHSLFFETSSLVA